jgi:HAD superfamily hydrolase (TIGR01509 family)
MVKAILWDNDGVLVDTEPLFFEATREALATVGVVLSRDEYTEISLRRGRSCFDLAADCGVAPERIERLRQARNRRYSSLLDRGVPVREGVRESLAALHGRFPMAIVTSSNADHFELMHAPLGLLEHFEFALTNRDYGKHKPDPEPYLTAATRLGIAPADCLVVEDTERGLESACRAGMPCLVVAHPFTREADFSRAHRVLASAAEIPDEVARLAAKPKGS